MILGTLIIGCLLFIVQGLYRNWAVYRGRRTEFDALPDHLNEQSEIDAAFPDDSQFANLKGILGVFGRAWKRFNKATKPWEAFGPRSRFSWAKWREIPTTVFAIKGKGRWRLERDYHSEQPDAALELGLNDRKRVAQFPEWYLSRIQYWTRWHLAVQWPLQITAHVYWHDVDVPAFPNRPEDLSLKKMLFVYGPTHRDADMVYWILSFFIGGTWK